MCVCACAYMRVCVRAQVSRSVCVMTTQVICKLLRSKEALAAVDIRMWPPVLDTGVHQQHGHTHPHTIIHTNTHSLEVFMLLLLSPDDLPKKKPPLLYKPSNPDTLAYLDFSVSTTGMLAGVQVDKRTHIHNVRQFEVGLQLNRLSCPDVPHIHQCLLPLHQAAM